MRKTLIAMSGAAVLSMLASVPASAFPFFLVPVLLAKEDKNFKAVNPYDKKVVRHGKQKRGKR